MPLVTAATIAYAAGLGIGFGNAPPWIVLIAGAIGGALHFAGRSRIAVLTIVGGAGALVALLSVRERANCAARLTGRSAWDVELHQDAAPRAHVRGDLTIDGCRLPASLTVRTGNVRAGDVALVRGSLTLSGGRAMIDGATVVSTGRTSTLLAMRTEAGRRIDRVFRGDAAMARALLIADARSLPPAMRARYADAGLVHMLSISGLHVAIIAAALVLVFQILRVSPQPARLGTILITACYIAMIGAPPPAVRSGVMLAATMITRLIQRPASPWAGIALGAAIPLLLDARAVLDLGYQLSVAGITALAASSALAGRLEIGRHRFGGFKRGLLASTVATVVTAPLIAWHFGRISLVAPLTNLAAGPVIGLAQPMLFLTLLLSPLEPLATFVADGVHPLLQLFDTVATVGAAAPFASVMVAPTLLAAVCGGVAATSFVVAASSRFPGRASLLAAVSLSVMVWAPDQLANAGFAELHMIDVGQGDAIALRSASGRWLVVDAGRQWRGGDAGRRTIIPYLRRRGGAVDGFVLSHPHADHAGGAASLIRALRPRHFWDPAFVEGNLVYRDLLREVAAARITWRRVRPAERYDFDGMRIEFLGPDSAWTAGLDDPNQASVVLLVRFGAVRFLLVGDAEQAEEAWLLEHARSSLRADVLKVGHHGSSTSSTPAFLDAVAPRVALISVGAGNTYRHPSPGVVHSLQSRHAQVLRTDQAGSVVVRTDGLRIWIHTEGGSWELPRSSGEH